MRVRFKTSYRPAAEQAGGFLPLRLTTGMDHQGSTIWNFELYIRRLLVTLAVLAISGYFAVVTALFYWLEQKPFNQVTWLDLAAPWHWSSLNQKRGDTAVLAGLESFKQRNYGDAYYQLRVGLVRSPNNAKGRIAMAQMLIAYDPVRAVTTMEDGIPGCVGDDRFVQGLVQVYATLQIEAHALTKIDALLGHPTAPLSPFSRSALERARFKLELKLGRAEAAMARLATWRALDEDQAALCEIEGLMQTGRMTAAAALFDGRFAQRLAEPLVAPVALELGVALGEAERVHSVLRRLKVRLPENTGVYLQGMQAWHRMKRPSLRDALENEFYEQFGHQENALQLLAAHAVNLDLPEVVSRAQARAVTCGFSPFAFRVHLTEIALRRGNINQAMQWLTGWELGVETLKHSQRFYPEFLRRLTRAAFTGADEQRGQLLNHLASNRGQARLPVYVLAGQVLAAAGDVEGIVRLTQAGLAFYPHSDALVALHGAWAGRGAVAATASVAPTTAPGRLLPATAADARAEWTQLLADGNWVEARDLLRGIRAQSPAWLETVESEVSLREVELACFTIDPIGSRNAVRGYLERYRSESDALALAEMAARLVKKEHVTEARWVKDELAARWPGHGAIQRALVALSLGDDLAAATATREAALAALDRALAGQDWAQAERVGKALRDKPPTWAAEAHVELKTREVRWRLGLDQPPLALAALKELVVKTGLPRAAAFKLVRELVAQEDFDRAQLLAREINRLLPGDSAAQRLLKETEVPRLAE